MTGWSGDFDAEPIPGSKFWRLKSSPRYTSREGMTFDLLPQFAWDGGSQPAPLWALVGHPMDPDFVKETALHDATCRSGWWSIKFCDYLMFEAMEVSGTPKDKRERIVAGLTLARTWRRKPKVDPLAHTYLQVGWDTDVLSAL